MHLRTLYLILFMAVLLSGISYVIIASHSPEKVSLAPIVISTPSSNMKIFSRAFQSGELIPSKYTCDGNNISPPLKISGIPKAAKSLALIVDDPDAPAGTWVHWIIWNINPQTTSIAEQSVPADAIEGKTSFGKSGYGGPCPPSGTHRYFFKIYALDTWLDLPRATDRAALGNAIAGRILDKAEIIGIYKRK